MKFIVSEEFFSKVPNAVFGVVVAYGVDNHHKSEMIQNLLQEGIGKNKKFFEGKIVKESIPIIYYRDAFKALGINPNKYMCSIEALVTRVVKKGEVPSINSLVDLGNALSLKYNIPLGIHDIDKFQSNIMIRPARADDTFIPFGAMEIEHPEEGEIIYASGNEVKTRRWTWRQGENSKITEDTSNIFIPLDAFLENVEDMKTLQKELIDILQNKLHAKVSYGIIDKDNREFEF